MWDWPGASWPQSLKDRVQQGSATTGASAAASLQHPQKGLMKSKKMHAEAAATASRGQVPAETYSQPCKPRSREQAQIPPATGVPPTRQKQAVGHQILIISL